MIVSFAVACIWQNIEFMKMKIDYSRYISVEKKLVKNIDRYIYEIERYKRVPLIENIAKNQGLKKINPNDFKVLRFKNEYE